MNPTPLLTGQLAADIAAARTFSELAHAERRLLRAELAPEDTAALERALARQQRNLIVRYCPHLETV